MCLAKDHILLCLCLKKISGCVHLFVCEYVGGLGVEETGALIYIDIYDVILPRGQPCQAYILQVKQMQVFFRLDKSRGVFASLLSGYLCAHLSE